MDVKHTPTRQTIYVRPQHAVNISSSAALYAADIRKISSEKDDRLEASLNSSCRGRNNSGRLYDYSRASRFPSSHSGKYDASFVQYPYIPWTACIHKCRLWFSSYIMETPVDSRKHKLLDYVEQDAIAHNFVLLYQLLYYMHRMWQ